MSDAASPASTAETPTSPELAAALEKAEKYKQKLHGAVKKGKSIESERDALREQLDAAVRDLATANTKLKVMREMEAVSVDTSKAAARACIPGARAQTSPEGSFKKGVKSLPVRSNLLTNAAAKAMIPRCRTKFNSTTQHKIRHAPRRTSIAASQNKNDESHKQWENTTKQHKTTRVTSRVWYLHRASSSFDA